VAWVDALASSVHASPSNATLLLLGSRFAAAQLVCKKFARAAQLEVEEVRLMRESRQVSLFQSRSGLWTLWILFIVCLSAQSMASAQTWNLTWSDEFNGSQIDSTKWAFDYGDLNVNDEIEFYCGPVGDPNNQSPCNSQNPNVYLDGSGHLVIQAFEISSGTAPYSNSWTSARLKTANLATFQYGRIESNMQLPTGAGLWPAFWALGTNIGSVGWPACGEEDYMENVPASAGEGPTIISSTLHGPTYYGTNGLQGKYTFPNGGRVDTAYHTYGAIWSPSMVQFYVDDPTNIFFVKTASDVPGGTSQWAFNHPFSLILNLAVGGTGSWPGPPDGTTPTPAVMTVDYVRQYTASPVTPPSLGNPAAITVKAGATSGNTSTMNLSSSSDIGRVYLTCSTTAPDASCTVASNDSLDIYTVNFSQSLTPTATVTITTVANNAQAGFLVGSRMGAIGLMILVLLLVSLCMQSGRSRVTAAPACLFLAMLFAPSCGGGSSGGGGGGGGGTTPGSYTISVGAYTVSNTGGAADATVTIPLTVN
jgi:beta-glucanase (GH16 family)